MARSQQRLRLKQSAAGTVDYILDLSGRTVSEVAANGTFSRGEVYIGGRHLATYNNGTTYFVHSDWLGTERSRTDANAAMYGKCSNLPFGDMQQCAGSGDPSPNHFAGKPRDTETNLDDFGARYFSSQYGRWMSPDWSATPTPLPYANMENPQSLNLYGYVSNDPITGEDADGHFRVNTSCFETSGCEATESEENQAREAQEQNQQQAQPNQQQSNSQNTSDKLNYKKDSQNSIPPAKGKLKKVLECTQHCAGTKFIITSTSEQLTDGKHGSNTPHGKGEAADLRVNKGEEGKVLQCAANCGARFGQDERAHPSGPGVPPHVHIQTVPGTHGGTGDLPDPQD